MIKKWYVIKVGDENKKKNPWLDNYMVQEYVDNLEKAIIDYGDTTVLITPSKEIAESTKKALNEKLREQSN